MQVQKFGLRDWEIRGKKASELDYVSGIEIWHAQAKTKCPKCGRKQDAIVAKIFVKQEEEDDEIKVDGVDLMIAEIQGEVRAYWENTCTVAWYGVINKCNPEGVWVKEEQVNWV